MSPKFGTAGKNRKAFIYLVVLLGVLIGLFALLFASANSSWIVVHLPSSLLSDLPARPAFEARLWWLLLSSFLAGLVVAAAIVGFACQAERSKSRELGKKIVELEAEITSLNRLLKATRNESKIKTQSTSHD